MTRPVRTNRFARPVRPILAGSAVAMMAALGAQAANAPLAPAAPETPAAPAAPMTVGAPPLARADTPAAAPITLDAAPEARPIVLAASGAASAAPAAAGSIQAEADRAAAAARRAAEASRDAARAAAEAEEAANEAAEAAAAGRDAVDAGQAAAPVAAPTPAPAPAAAPAAAPAEDPNDLAVVARYAAAPGFKLGEAELDRWTERPVSAGGSKGAVAQVNARGEGRFAVVCMEGDRGALAYRAPLKMREALLASGDTLTVDFIFDGSQVISRTMAWNEQGRYWTGPFGPDSALADRMKKALAVTIDVKGFDGVASEFSLDNSWRSIEAMFNDC